jgi:Family of unknown function (DUF6922)
METRVPEIFKPILWSYDFDQIDPAKHAKSIIVNAINYGTLAHWRWLRAHYGADRVRSIIGSIPATEIRPRAQRLAALVFGIDRFNHAPRGTH